MVIGNTINPAKSPAPTGSAKIFQVLYRTLFPVFDLVEHLARKSNPAPHFLTTTLTVAILTMMTHTLSPSKVYPTRLARLRLLLSQPLGAKHTHSESSIDLE